MFVCFLTPELYSISPSLLRVSYPFFRDRELSAQCNRVILHSDHISRDRLSRSVAVSCFLFLCLSLVLQDLKRILLFAYLKGRARVRARAKARERKRNTEIFYIWATLQTFETALARPSQSHKPRTYSRSPRGRMDHNSFRDHLLSPRVCISRKLKLGVELGPKPGALMRDSAILTAS